MRFPEWPRGVRAPQLLDVISQTSGAGTYDEDDVQRAYEVFGVFETATGYRLHCERVSYDRYTDRIQSALDRRCDPRDVGAWTFYNLPRR